MSYLVFLQFAEPISCFNRERLTPLLPHWALLQDAQNKWAQLFSANAPTKIAVLDDVERSRFGLSIHTATPPSPLAITAIRDLGIDINVLTTRPRRPRLAMFDMDATLIHDETLDVLAERWLSQAGGQQAERIQQLTAQAMQGKISFRNSLDARLHLLSGMPESLADQMIAEGLDLHQGVAECLRGLQRQGTTCVLASGGFQPFARAVEAQLSLDAAHCNRWQVDANGLLTGRCDWPIVDGIQKRKVLMQEAQKRGIALAETLAMGDGANDLPMLSAAGLSVAWRGKANVRAKIPLQLNHAPMSALLDWFED